MSEVPPAVRELRLVVTADDYDEALRFYRDVLGLPERAAFSSPDGRVTILEAGRATLEYGLLIMLAVSLMAANGVASSELDETCRRALALCRCAVMTATLSGHSDYRSCAALISPHPSG